MTNFGSGVTMILTAAFIISKAIGASWSWWWLLLTVPCDYSFRDDLVIRTTK